MIDVMRSVATTATIQTPPFINGADTQSASSSPASGFCIGYFFAGVLRDLSVTLEVSG
jgi:hypothetical protein